MGVGVHGKSSSPPWGWRPSSDGPGVFGDHGEERSNAASPLLPPTHHRDIPSPESESRIARSRRAVRSAQGQCHRREAWQPYLEIPCLTMSGTSASLFGGDAPSTSENNDVASAVKMPSAPDPPPKCCFICLRDRAQIRLLHWMSSPVNSWYVTNWIVPSIMNHYTNDAIDICGGRSPSLT